jgi:protein-disulfide isomerase
LPAWAKRSGLAPDSSRPGYTVAGDAYKGDPKAPLAVIEFSDFQCAACRKHSLEVQPAIDAALVNTGKVLWVSKHLPLRMHPQAALAAVAAECAGDQGRYWDMSRKLFETTERWANDRAELELPALAAEVGLDRAAFARCFDGRKALERVLADLYDAKGVVERTPSFVILSDDKTGSITGPLPADQFIRLLQDRAAGAVVDKKE